MLKAQRRIMGKKALIESSRQRESALDQLKSSAYRRLAQYERVVGSASSGFVHEAKQEVDAFHRVSDEKSLQILNKSLKIRLRLLQSV